MNVAAYDASNAIILLSAPKLQWKSSSNAFASVDTNGRVTGVKAGSCNITVTDSESGKSATVQLVSTVIAPIAFAAPVLYNTIGPSPNNEVLTADFDGDGKMDIVVGTNTDLEILYGNGDGTFQPAKTILSFTGGVFPWSAADMNGDGKPDITCTVTNGFIMIPNMGGRSFGSPTEFGANAQVGSLVTADFNGDGKPDVAIIVHDHPGETSTDIMIFQNMGGGNFTQVSTIANIWIVLDISTGDLNGDGKPDLIASITTDEEGASGSSIYFGDGTGHFTGGGGVGTASFNVDESVIADFNGDGRQDYALANDTQGNISFVFNTGAGTFGTPITSGGTSHPDHLRAVDLDGDGRPDLIIENRDAAYFTVMRNSNGLFPTQIQVPSGGACEPLTTGDVNKDGKPDVIISLTYNNQVAVVLNTTP